MKKLLLSLVFAVLSIGIINAQDRFDAIRLSQNFYEGTARFTSMGGAFAALGGDFTSLSINPAGVAVYRGMEFTITPAVSYSSTSSSYGNISNVSDSRTRFGLSNMGFVTPIYNSGSSKGLISMNVGIGYNKLNNFNSNASMVGANIDANQSMINTIHNQAADVFGDLDFDQSVGNWPVVMAWENFILADNGYDLDVDIRNHSKYAQTKSEGNIGEYVLSFGGNVSHKLYFGFTVGIQDVNYESTKLYEEIMNNPTNLSNFIFDQYYKTSGAGYNLKAGVIYRPIPDLRLAFAVHTPTFFDLTDEYSAFQLAYYSDDGSEYTINSPRNYYDYRVNTPYKLIAGAAYTFKNYGLISVDYEFIDYSSMRMKEHIDYWGPNGFDSENYAIKNTLRAASNLRVGVEGNLPAGFALRAGYSYYGSPYKSNIKEGDDYGYILADNGNVTAPNYSIGVGDNTTNVYSAGIGYRFKYGFVDFGYSLTKSKVEYLLDTYNSYGVILPVTTENKFSRFALTFGLKF